MRFLSTILFSLPFSLAAQSTLTESLRHNAPGRGVVVISQSEAIERVVNEGNVRRQEVTPQQSTPVKADNAVATEHSNATKTHSAKTTKGSHVDRGRHRARGFRICIFTGGNSKNDKTQAMQIGQKCRNAFPELAVYTTFISPRWVTHVGDFRNQAEAAKYVNLIKRAGFTYEARIVGSVVNLPDKN